MRNVLQSGQRTWKMAGSSEIFRILLGLSYQIHLSLITEELPLFCSAKHVIIYRWPSFLTFTQLCSTFQFNLFRFRCLDSMIAVTGSDGVHAGQNPLEGSLASTPRPLFPNRPKSESLVCARGFIQPRPNKWRQVSTGPNKTSANTSKKVETLFCIFPTDILIVITLQLTSNVFSIVASKYCTWNHIL